MPKIAPNAQFVNRARHRARHRARQPRRALGEIDSDALGRFETRPAACAFGEALCVEPLASARNCSKEVPKCVLRIAT